MKYNHIFELLDYTRHSISYLKDHGYESQFEIKSILENLRSILDYSAYYTAEKLKIKNKVYFPYAKKEIEFKRNFKNNFGEIRNEYPKLYSLMEDLQPYKCGDNWILILCNATNKFKHRNPLEIQINYHTKKQITKLDIPGIQCGQFGINQINSGKLNVEIGSMTFNNIPMDDFTIEDGILKVSKSAHISPNIQYANVEQKEYIINEYECNLINLLETSLMYIHNFIYQLIESDTIKNHP